MNGFTVELFNASAAPKLDAYLSKNPKSTIFHSLQWHQVIHATYGHKCDYWVAWLNEEIVGVFPVVVVRHRIMGTKMLAMAYQLHSGLPLGMSETIQIELIKRAAARACEVGAKFLEIRHHEAAPFLEEIGFRQMQSQLVTTSSPLVGVELNNIRRNHRRNIRYAAEHGVSISEGKALEHLKVFRRMYLVEGRKLGAPQAGWDFFENLHRLARSHYRLFLAWLSNRCVGGLLVLDDGRTVFARCGAYNSPEAQRFHVGKALLWRCMSDAAARGCLGFNFGVSSCDDEGLISFKEGWNANTRPVYLYIYPIRSKPRVPGDYLDGFTLAKAIWRRLPLPVVDWAGRQVTQWVG